MVRIADHTGVCARTGKPFSNRPKSDIFDCCQICRTDVLSEKFHYRGWSCSHIVWVFINFSISGIDVRKMGVHYEKENFLKNGSSLRKGKFFVSTQLINFMVKARVKRYQKWIYKINILPLTQGLTIVSRLTNLERW